MTGSATKSTGRFFYNIHNLVSISSTLRLEMIPDYFLVPDDGGPSRAKVGVEATSADRVAGDGSWVYSYHPFRGTLTRVGIQQNGELVSLRFYDSAYRYFTRLRYPISQLIAGLVQFQLVKLGYLIVHGACLRGPDGTGTVLVGLSNVGKTTTTLRLVRDHGYRFLSDDMLITDGSIGWGFPRSLRLENFGDIKLTPNQRAAPVKRALWEVASMVPFLPEVWIHPYKAPPTGPFEPVASVKLGKLFFLHRRSGKPELRSLGREEAFRELVIQHRIGTIDYDFAASRLFHMYAYETEEVDFNKLLSVQTEVLQALIQNCSSYAVFKETPLFTDEIVRGAPTESSNPK